MPVGEQTFRRLALEDPGGRWELHGGRLRRKSGMTIGHNHVAFELPFALRPQRDPRAFRVRHPAGHAHLATRGYHQRRGDLEIWQLHPYERTLTGWRRRLDGYYGASVHSSSVRPVALPGVSIDLDRLFG